MIPLDLRNGAVMLAQQSKTLDPDVHTAVQKLHQGGLHTFEPKWDGVRCLLLVEDGKVTLIGRKGRDETVRYPELESAPELLALPNGTVLDGELLVFSNGQPIFNLMQRRNSQSAPAKIAALSESLPATFMAFDCLMVNGADLRPASLEARRKMLRTVVKAETERLRLTPHTADGTTLWQFALDNKMEGLIAKANSSAYRARRDTAWIKLKTTVRSTFLIADYDTGDGKRTGMVGAIKLALLEDGVPVEYGEVGTGFTEVEATELKAAIDTWKAGVADALANGTTPPAPLLAEVEYQEVTRDKRLRFPSWRGLRHDIDWTECTTAQIGA